MAYKVTCFDEFRIRASIFLDWTKKTKWEKLVQIYALLKGWIIMFSASYAVYKVVTYKQITCEQICHRDKISPCLCGK